MEKLTAMTLCMNEAHNIEAALESVRWADEIMVVDSLSTDDTVERARRYTNFILQREYVNSASQRNWALPQASHDWILVVDADERVTPELKEQVLAVLRDNKPGCDAYWVPIRNRFMGREIRFSGWQGDKGIRLFRKSKCRYDDKHVHAELLAEGKVGRLTGRLLHNTYRDMDQYLRKWDRYTTWSAKDAAQGLGNPNVYHLFIKPVVRFFKHYVWQLGFLDGVPGLVISALSAFAVFMRYVKLYEMRRTGAEAASHS